MTDQTPQHLFEKRAIELAHVFGIDVSEYAALDETHRHFFEAIGYVRVCSMMVISDLKNGRSERQLATKYSLSRDQIRTIKQNSCLSKRRQKQLAAQKVG